MNQKKEKGVMYLLIGTIGVLMLSANSFSLKAQSTAVKTNLLYWGSLSPNLGFETAIGGKYTLEIPVSYNPWTFSENKKWKHILVQPEIRRWICEPFNGHFFGLHLHYAYYNVGNVDIGDFKLPGGVQTKELNDHRYKGWLGGAGLTYGYQFYLSPRFNLELAIGAGYAYIDYEKYECAKCGKFIAKEKQNYIGPTKAAISLVYLLK